MTDPYATEPLSYPGRDLEAMEAASNYHRWIADRFAPFLGHTIAEVGAGIGQFTERLRAPGKRVTAFEPAAELFPLLQARFRDGTVDTRHGRLEDFGELYTGAFDTVVYVNVLEHLDDDTRELGHARDALRDDGYLCIFVPALPALFSPFDAEIGHRRRYRLQSLRERVVDGGFAIERLEYFDLVGALGWFLAFRMLRGRLHRAQVAGYDRWVVPWMRRVEARWRIPLGKNLLCVARKST
jgi:SAM-dependent methyltransferase